MADSNNQQRLRARLSNESKKLLETIDEMHELEEQKRQEDISTPRFHELADTIKAKARNVFQITTVQEHMGDAIETTDQTLNEADPEGDHQEQVADAGRTSGADVAGQSSAARP
jgi:hypothetical protein